MKHQIKKMKYKKIKNNKNKKKKNQFKMINQNKHAHIQNHYYKLKCQMEKNIFY